MAPTKTVEAEWYVAAESFATSDGIAYSANITRVRKGHPDRKKFPHLFKLVEASPETNLVPGAIEQATAAPGEERGAEK